MDGDTISALGGPAETPPQADRVVDATGLVVTPGFIDVHSHSDLLVVAGPELTGSLLQGITTMVVGNCGLSPAPLARRTAYLDLAPQLIGLSSRDLSGLLHRDDVAWQSFGEFLDAVEEARPAANVAALVGFGTLRTAVVGDPSRPADAREVAGMRRLLATALDEGAIGMSTGLIYDPDRSASRDEVLAVAGELRGRGRYASHLRGEGAELWDAVEEALTVARAGVPVQVSHLKLEGSAVWGQADRLLGMLAAARAEGLQVEGDQYPYAAYETSLSAFFPAWAGAGDLAALLAGPDAPRLRAAVEHGEDGWQSSVDGVGWGRIVVAQHRDSAQVGRAVHSYDSACRLLLDDPTCVVVGHAMQEEDVRALLLAPEVAVSTDSLATPGDGGPLDRAEAHPRGFGSCPRVLGHYVRELGLLSLEAAVRKMTSVPAAQLGLVGRGVLAVGAAADLVVLDPATVGSSASYLEPHRHPTGIRTVVVNGRIAVEGSRVVGRHGAVLRSAASRS